ncbi:MAG: hypothetical protein SPiBPW_30100 [Shewanella algae]
MKLDELLKQLKDLSPEKQIDCLNKIRLTANPKQKELIEFYADSADRPWLRSALLGIANSSKVKVDVTDQAQLEGVDSEDIFDKDAIKSEAISESIGQVLHELEPIIGSLKVFAEREVNNYPISRVKHELDKLDEVLETFEDWRRVEQSPTFRNVNVYEIILTEVERISPKSKVEIRIDVSKDLFYVLSPALLRIILSNALRNAVESSNQPTAREKNPIIIRGGSTADSVWFSIIDDGLGLKSEKAILLKSRHTTKPGNRGLGLAIINKAVISMGGKWNLVDSKPHGAELYFEVPERK